MADPNAFHIVRHLAGDNDNTIDDVMLSFFMESSNNNVWAAAALTADALSAYYSSDTSASIGDVSASGGRHDQYAALARRLRRQVAIRTATPYAGGISQADKTTVADNDDRVEPSFSRDLHEVSNSVNTTSIRDNAE